MCYLRRVRWRLLRPRDLDGAPHRNGVGIAQKVVGMSRTDDAPAKQGAHACGRYPFPPGFLRRRTPCVGSGVSGVSVRIVVVILVEVDGSPPPPVGGEQIE